MRIPAMRGKIGNTIYYITNMSFETLAKFVNRQNVEEIYKSGALKDALQRSLTDNVTKIKDYILSHNDRFFNALVLAVYDGDPRWKEIEFGVDDEEYCNVGLLEFNGNENIFPIDGQHRLEGIKKAIGEREDLRQETVPVILIGHESNAPGNEKTRRIFSTLNRYAKPVRKGDIVALDEDDVVAICTRILLENHSLFMSNHVKIGNSKSIPATDKTSFTTLMTLYDCMDEIFKAYSFSKTTKILSSSQLSEYKKKRPDDLVINEFTDFASLFWSSLCDTFNELKTYSSNSSEDCASSFRPNGQGGHLLFRPVGLLPFVTAVCQIKIKKQLDTFNNIFEYFRQYDIMNVSSSAWEKILWNPLTNKMVMHNNDIVVLLLLSLYDSNILTNIERNKLIEKFSTIFSVNDQRIAEERINSHFQIC